MVRAREWWDDSPENGGALIGHILRCTTCDWEGATSA